MPFERDENEIGALWKKTGAKGEYFTGVVNGEKIVAFANTRKTSDKAPDFRILKSRPRESAPTPTNDDFVI